MRGWSCGWRIGLVLVPSCLWAASGLRVGLALAAGYPPALGGLLAMTLLLVSAVALSAGGPWAWLRWGPQRTQSMAPPDVGASAPDLAPMLDVGWGAVITDTRDDAHARCGGGGQVPNPQRGEPEPGGGGRGERRPVDGGRPHPARG